MIDYVIITRNRVYESEPEDILAEQLEKQKVLELDNGNYGFVAYYSGEVNGFEVIG